MDLTMPDAAGFELEERGREVRLRAYGAWTVARAGALERSLSAVLRRAMSHLSIDLAQVDVLDTAGAYLVYRTQQQMRRRNIPVSIEGVRSEFQILLDEVEEHARAGPGGGTRPKGLLAALDRVGRGVRDVCVQTVDMLGLCGQVFSTLALSVVQPGRVRLISLVNHMERAGLNAVPIVALLTFLIGAVVSFLGARTLQSLGGDVFVVELVSFGVLRELGVLLAAIITAGRSGSAFTAEIGSMRANEEIDALQTLGLSVVEVLVIPRILAFVLMLPLLTVIGDFMGILGGMLTAWAVLDVSPGMFLARMHEVVPLQHLWVGLIKAPFFAFAVALIGCYEGLMVEGSAESVGRRTTRSVVQAIFAVILMDALFALFFMEINY